MKKKKYIIAAIITFFICLLNVKADMNHIEVLCPKNIKENEEVKCNINLLSDGSFEYFGFNGNIEATEGFEFKKFEYNDAWDEKSEVNNIHSLVNSYKSTALTDKSYYLGSLIGVAKKDFDKITITVSGHLLNNDKEELFHLTTITSEIAIEKITTTAAKSNNSYLKEITIDGNKLVDFNKDNVNYTIDVSNDKETIVINPIAEDSKSIIKVLGPDNLEEGKNEYTILVIAEDETTKTYKIIVNREKENIVSTKLENIIIKGFNFDFNDTSKTFYVKVNKETTKLNIDVVQKDEKAKVEILDNENLMNGSVITINVSNDNGDKTSYRIIVEKDEKNNNILIYILIGLISVSAIVTIVILIVKNKKNNKKNNNSDTKKVEKIKDDEFYMHEEEIDNDEEEKTKIIKYIENQDNDEEDSY